MSLRSQLSWMVRGQRHVTSSIDSLSADLRSLQQQVADLSTAVDQLASSQAALDDRQLDELDRIRGAVAAATDDLAARMTAVEERARSRA